MHLSRTAALGLPLLFLTACQQQPATIDSNQAAGPSRSTDVAETTQAMPEPSNSGAAAEQQGGTDEPAASEPQASASGKLPPPGGLRFVGLWASDVKNCSGKAWRFTDTSLATPAGSRCTFTKVTQVPGGYDIAATCTAEGPPKDETIELRFAESAQAMLFESDAIADAGLIYCGREG